MDGLPRFLQKENRIVAFVNPNLRRYIRPGYNPIQLDGPPLRIQKRLGKIYKILNVIGKEVK